MIKDLEKAMRGIAMEIHMKVILLLEKPMEKVFTHGLTERSTMENGPKELRKVMECGEEYSVTAIWDNGIIVRLTVMESTNGKMAIVTKAAGQIV